MRTPWKDTENDESVFESQLIFNEGITVMKIRAVKDSNGNYNAILRDGKGTMLSSSFCQTTKENAKSIAMGLAYDYFINSWQVQID